MAKLNLVQQGAELSYLLLHDPSSIRASGATICSRWATNSSQGQYQADLRDPRPADRWIPLRLLRALGGAGGGDPVGAGGNRAENHIFGTEFKYNASGEIESWCAPRQATGRLRGWNNSKKSSTFRGPCGLRGRRQLRHSRHAAREPARRLHHCRVGVEIGRADRKRTVLGDNALATLVPILEEIAGWQRPQIRQLFESYGFLIQDGTACRPTGSRCGRAA